MNEKLKKIKDLLEKSIESENKKDLFIGQALGLLESLISESENMKTLPIPDMIWKHAEKPSNLSMQDAIQRHKDIHSELSKNSITKQNTQFEQLK